MHFRANLQRHGVPLGIPARHFRGNGFSAGDGNEFKRMLADWAGEVGDLGGFLYNHGFAVGAGYRNPGRL